MDQQHRQGAFEEFGHRFTIDQVRMNIGKGGDLLVPDLLDARAMRESGSKIRKYRKQLFLEEFLPKVKPFPGVRDSLEGLRGRGIRLFLASSAQPNEVEHYVELIGIEDLIDGSTSAGDADLSKPSPEIFEAALDKIPAPKSRTMIVGDTPYDILAGHRASTPVAAVRCGGFPEDSLQKAEWIFDDVREFAKEIESIDEYFTR